MYRLTGKSARSFIVANALAFLCGGQVVSAGIIRVDIDSVAENPNGDSWAAAFPNLDDALEICGDNGVVDQIWLAEGVYTPDLTNGFRVLADCEVYGGFAGWESLRSQRDWETQPSILDGDINGNDNPNDSTTKSDNANHVVLIFSAGLRVLDGVTIRNGYALSGGGNTSLDGAGIQLSGADLTVRNCIIRDNFTVVTGGGIVLTGAAHLRISNSVVCSNEAQRGGGLGAKGSSHQIDCFNVKFTRNTAEDLGGGLFIEGAVSPSNFTNTLVADNTAMFSGRGH